MAAAGGEVPRWASAERQSVLCSAIERVVIEIKREYR